MKLPDRWPTSAGLWSSIPMFYLIDLSRFPCREAKSLRLKSRYPGGPHPTGDEILLEQTVGAGHIRQETLYQEIRRSAPNPADWFDATASEAIR
jgi:hypothetical protein